MDHLNGALDVSVDVVELAVLAYSGLAVFNGGVARDQLRHQNTVAQVLVHALPGDDVVEPVVHPARQTSVAPVDRVERRPDEIAHPVEVSARLLEPPVAFFDLHKILLHAEVPEHLVPASLGNHSHPI